MIRTLLLVGFGGGMGCMLRYLVSVGISKFYANPFPLATFLINVSGCFLIGLLMGFLAKSQISSPDLKWLLVTGFCGGYTTFSAFGYENMQLLQSNQSGTALAYIGASLVVGLLAVWLGLFITR